MEQAEELIVSGEDDASETVGAGRNALGNGEEEAEAEAVVAEIALDSPEFQGDTVDDSTEAEVGASLGLPPPASASSNNSFANCCGLM